MDEIKSWGELWKKRKWIILIYAYLFIHGTVYLIEAEYEDIAKYLPFIALNLAIDAALTQMGLHDYFKRWAIALTLSCGIFLLLS